MKSNLLMSPGVALRLELAWCRFPGEVQMVSISRMEQKAAMRVVGGPAGKVGLELEEVLL